MPTPSKIRIATRKSPLATWQAEHIKARLEALHPGLEVELVTFTTQGDKILDVPLAKIGGKGLFVKELESAMLDGRADIAVHSMKDVPMEFPEGLELGVICDRENPLDAFVSNKYKALAEMPEGSVLGTSSLRRGCQAKERRPDLEVKSLRGNVQTRLGKMDAGEYDAIILPLQVCCVWKWMSALPHSCRQKNHCQRVDRVPLGLSGAVLIKTFMPCSRRCTTK